MERRAEHTAVCVLLQEVAQESLINLPPLSPSSASAEGQWLPWSRKDQIAQGHYLLLQPFLLVFCYHLDATGKWETRALQQAGGVTPSLGSEEGTDLAEWARRLEDHHKH